MAPAENQSHTLHKVLKIIIPHGDKGRDERTFLCKTLLPSVSLGAINQSIWIFIIWMTDLGGQFISAW